MKNVVAYRPDSDELYELTRGYAMANRINDVWANPNSKRYQEYLALVRDQYIGEPAIDHNDQYRERAKELLPRALQAYEYRNGCTVRRGLLYFHSPEIHIAAAPDAVEAGLVGITVHVRQTEETYFEAVERGVDEPMRRHAQAMMAVTRLENWVHLDYWEDANVRKRKLYEHLVAFDERHADELEELLMGFVLQSRLRAAS